MAEHDVPESAQFLVLPHEFVSIGHGVVVWSVSLIVRALTLAELESRGLEEEEATYVARLLIPQVPWSSLVPGKSPEFEVTENDHLVARALTHVVLMLSADPAHRALAAPEVPEMVELCGQQALFAIYRHFDLDAHEITARLSPDKQSGWDPINLTH
jgi:hypothetical protein